MGLNAFEIAIPLTFHIENDDCELQKHRQTSKGVWIIKPGENTNRGCGIQVSDNIKEITKLIQ